MLRTIQSSIDTEKHTSNMRCGDHYGTTALQLITADGTKTLLRNVVSIEVIEVLPRKDTFVQTSTHNSAIQEAAVTEPSSELRARGSARCHYPDAEPEPGFAVDGSISGAKINHQDRFGVNLALDTSDAQVQSTHDRPSTLGPTPAFRVCSEPNTRSQQSRRIYSDDEWASMKPILHTLYIEDSLCLESVMNIMSDEHDFHPTIKMYKTRLKRWKWRKNKLRGSEIADTLSSAYGSRRRRRAGVHTVKRIPHIKSPDSLRTQELSFYASKVYTQAQFDSHGWTHGPFTICSNHREAGSNGTLDFFALETLSIYTMHHMRQGNFVSAYGNLNAIFDGMRGFWGTLHPKLLVGFWLLFRKVYDICVLARDDQFGLLRVFMRFHGHSANQYLTEESPGSSNPLPRLIMVLVEMSKREPGLIERVFRYCSIAAADSLEEKIGLDHPTVLLAWGNNLWYWKVPVLVSKDLKARFEAILARAGAEHEPASPLLIGILWDFALVVYHSNEHRQYERRLVKDLLSRTAVHVRTGAPPERSQVTRAHASGTVLACIHALEDGDLALCEKISQEAIDWFASGGQFMRMYAEMVEADRETLICGWRDEKELRGLFLNFVRPRCIDMERESPTNNP